MVEILNLRQTSVTFTEPPRYGQWPQEPEEPKCSVFSVVQCCALTARCLVLVASQRPCKLRTSVEHSL